MFIKGKWLLATHCITSLLEYMDIIVTRLVNQQHVGDDKQYMLSHIQGLLAYAWLIAGRSLVQVIVHYVHYEPVFNPPSRPELKYAFIWEMEVHV